MILEGKDVTYGGWTVDRDMRGYGQVTLREREGNIRGDGYMVLGQTGM